MVKKLNVPGALEPNEYQNHRPSGVFDLVYAWVRSEHCGIPKSTGRPENERAESGRTGAENSDFSI